MWNFLTAVWRGFIKFVAILLPFGKGAGTWRMGPGLRWALHVALLVLIVVILYFLNGLFFTPAWSEPPGPRTIFLPLVFLLVYFAALDGLVDLEAAPGRAGYLRISGH